MATRSNVRSVVADAQDKGREAVEAVSEVRDNVAVAIDKSLKKRPYTTLALTLGVGFVLGAMWARYLVRPSSLPRARARVATKGLRASRPAPRGETRCNSKSQEDRAHE
jgi:hypothetical protein